MTPFTLQQLISAIQGTAQNLNQLDRLCPSVSIDSRSVRRGELFFALKGETHNGHHFLEQAYQNGAVASVVQRGESIPDGSPCIVVEDSLQALGCLARWYRQQQDALVIGVTGSVGKTSTREMIYAALQEEFQGCRSPKNYNNEFGVPLSLFELRPEDEFAVLELAAGQVGDIEYLTDIVQPEIGVITEIAPAHLQTFKTIENITHEKGMLLESLPESGFAVINGDNPRVRDMASRAKCPVVTVGFQEQNDFRATHVQHDQGQIWFELEGVDYYLKAFGQHHIYSALMAIAIGQETGVSTESLQNGLAAYEAVSGRSRWVRFGEVIVIDDTYNASPASMKAAVRALGENVNPGKKVMVAGDMLELGPGEIYFHQQLGRDICEFGIDQLITFGNYSAHVVEGAMKAGFNHHHLADCKELDTLFLQLSCWVEPGDLVLVKGSRGMKMERVVEWLKQNFEANNLDNRSRQPARSAA